MYIPPRRPRRLPRLGSAAPDAVVEVGPLLLEVPLRVETEFLAGYASTWDAPGAASGAEVISVTRLDGLPMHAGVEAAFDTWWTEGGEGQMLSRHLDAIEDAEADAADRARDAMLCDDY